MTARRNNQPTTARRDNQPTTARQCHGVKRRMRWREMRGGEAARRNNQPTAQRGTRELTTPKVRKTDRRYLRRQRQSRNMRRDRRRLTRSPDDAPLPRSAATRTTTTMGDRPTLPPVRRNNQLIGDSLGTRREERGAILEDATT